MLDGFPEIAPPDMKLDGGTFLGAALPEGKLILAEGFIPGTP